MLAVKGKCGEIARAGNTSALSGHLDGADYVLID